MQEGNLTGKIGFLLLAVSLLASCATTNTQHGEPTSRLRASVRSWNELEKYHFNCSRQRFESLLKSRYAPSDALASCLTITDEEVSVYASPDKQRKLWTLKFSKSEPQRTFGHRAPDRGAPPLSGWRIALDPGHIGGEWARMEERFFSAALKEGDKPLPPIQEAAANLIVARLLRQRLETLGATVLMVKNDLQPVTTMRPEDFRQQAQREVARSLSGDPVFANMPPLLQQAYRADLVRKRMELLFYRHDEIGARAEIVNSWKPDVTLCIHFNAKDWTLEKDKLTEDNRLVVFVHGNYLPSELQSEEGKLALFAKLLEGSAPTELKLADCISRALAKSTGLAAPNKHPSDGSSGWLQISENPYVYARNLLANRLFKGPVIYIEPYYQNNRIVYQRILAGDYEGEREIAGQKFRSIFREYADGVVEGLLQFNAPASPAPSHPRSHAQPHRHHGG